MSSHKHLTPDQVSAVLNRLDNGPLRSKLFAAWDRRVPLHLTAQEGCEVLACLEENK